MIKDKIKNIAKYKINEAFELFKNKIAEENNLLKIAPPFKAIPLEYETKSFDLSKFENHRKFIDIHYIKEGQEEIGLTPVEELKPNMEYDQDNDYQLFYGEVNEIITLKEGEFLLLFPDEAHVTGGLVNQKTNDVSKIVFKIPL